MTKSRYINWYGNYGCKKRKVWLFSKILKFGTRLWKLGLSSQFCVTTRSVGTTCPVGPRLTADQLVTACPVGMLLKGEVLGSRLTNNLIMELERTHNGGVGVGALQRCEPGAHGAGSSHRAGCHIKSRLFMWQPIPLTRNPAHSPGGTDPNPSIMSSLWLHN